MKIFYDRFTERFLSLKFLRRGKPVGCIKTRFYRGEAVRAAVLLALSLSFIMVLSAASLAQLVAVSGPEGTVVLTWSGSPADIYRDTSPLKGSHFHPSRHPSQ